MVRLTTLAVSVIAVAGCASYTRPLPALPHAPADEEPLKLSPNARQTRLKVIVFDLPMGHTYGQVSWGYGGGCFRQKPLVNTSGNFEMELNQYSDVFRRVMTKSGYSVESEVELFRDAKERVADLLVAARVVDATINECFPYADEDKLRVRGSAHLRIEWSVFSSIEKKVILATITEGTTYSEIRSTVGEAGLLRVAFEDAVGRLARSPQYRDAIDPPKPARLAAAAAEGKVRVKRASSFSGELKRNLEAVRRSVATVTANAGSGSGFVLSEDGAFVTAAHVVAGSKYVKVNLAGGKECYGEVVASNKPRDLALVRLDCSGLTPLPLSPGKVPEGTDVFAAGTPLSDKLPFSVTKGVVSGVRRFADMDFIQSDVTVLPGNSGGPLLDASGNAIGVAVAAVTLWKVPVGVNLFAPVADIETYLPIDLE